MPKINVLPKSVAELIAAGEVVERPASVVKELIENSIDAGSTNISVEIKGGGVRYIRVTDNGCGISRSDVRTAFISHATSKISDASDLDAIFTLGFRGEALPSIAAVSKLSLLTRTAYEDIGTSYDIAGGEETALDDAGCPYGSTFIVRDLFFNTPARMKFLKRDVTEGTYVSDVVAKTAISHPGVRFSLVRDGKEVLSTPGSGDLYSAVYAVFGKDTAEGLIPCDYEFNSVKVSGFISRPLNNRPNRNMQYFYVNGRFVRIPAAVPALDEAYKNRIMVGKFPMCFLFLDIPAETLDVNVHPAKTEVRFSDDRMVFESVFYAAKSALAKGDTERPSVKLENKNIPEKTAPAVEQLKMTSQPPIGRASTPEQPKPVPQPALSEVFAAEQPKVMHRSTINSQSAVGEKTVHTVFNDSSSIFSSVPEATSAEEENIPKKTAEETVRHVFSEPERYAPVSVGNRTDYAKAFSEQPKKKVEIDITYDEPEFRIVGEVFKTYIIVEYENKLLLIDKHAAHERMIFNSLAKDAGSASQFLLAPVSVFLTAKEYTAVLESLELFEKAGYGIEDFGNGAVIVRACPVALEKEDISSVITEIAGELAKGNLRPTPEKLDWLYHSTACRAAVKAGDELKPEETETLVKKLLSDEDVRYCPHGRPVIYELTKHEIEKQFGRLG